MFEKSAPASSRLGKRRISGQHGKVSVVHRIRVTQRKTHQQAIGPAAPGVLRIDRNRQRLKLLRVHAPVDAERFYPVQDLLHIGLGQGKSSLQHGKIQQRTDFPGIEPTLRQAEQGKKSLHQCTLLGKRMFGERKGDVPGSGR